VQNNNNNPKEMRQEGFVKNVMILDPMGYLIELDQPEIHDNLFDAFPNIDVLLTVGHDNNQILIDKNSR
jgi:hypothetical protein